MNWGESQRIKANFIYVPQLALLLFLIKLQVYLFVCVDVPILSLQIRAISKLIQLKQQFDDQKVFIFYMDLLFTVRQPVIPSYLMAENHLRHLHPHLPLSSP